MKKINEVFETTNYGIFKFSEFNRNVVYRKDLMDEAKQGFIAPIIVNEDFMVIDGQSRLKHAEYAKVPIKYMVVQGLTEKDIVKMNTTQLSWSLKDYIQSYANSGKKEYQLLIGLLNERYANPSSVIAVALNKTDTGSKPTSIVKNGKFEFSNYEKTVEFLKYYKRFITEAGVKDFSKLPMAVHAMYKIKKIDEEYLIKKVRESKEKDEFNVNKDKNRFLEELLETYNFRVHASSNRIIDYHIDRHGKIIIDEEMKYE
ncbi:hypothetical protein INS17_09075 [Staphylococcus haemolyticus]|uniref:hypothetical protein n=1 Tax=Staphylococcus haemolyticus TaxID=1283 RepID=UPI0018797F13|nr:hypothetical protein [Staphylococcus haemolyticus]MBE7356687.1 hypothetical protein [Staphylococcus haemolyticus]